MSDTIKSRRHAEWFDFSLPLGQENVPVRISREALEDHFGADAFETLGHAYRHHAADPSSGRTACWSNAGVYVSEPSVGS